MIYTDALEHMLDRTGRICTSCACTPFSRTTLATHVETAQDGIQRFACLLHARRALDKLHDVEPIGVFFDNVEQTLAFVRIFNEYHVGQDTIARLKGRVVGWAP